VVIVDLKVSLGMKMQTNAAVHGDLVEHVVEKAHAGIDDNLAAVKPQGQLNVRFFCLAHNCCRTFHIVSP
jgi:hypothetical protein